MRKKPLPAAAFAIAAAALAITLAASGCASTSTSSETSSVGMGAGASSSPGYVRDLQPADFRDYVETHADVYVIDLRTDSERASDFGPFPNAVAIPHEQLESRLSDLPKDPAVPVAVFDRTGLRSVTAARLIADRGHREVLTLLGGLDAYRRAGL